MERFDVAVVGAGVVGAAIARTLSAYDLRVVLLEKEADVAFGVSKANSGIVHAGFHHAAHSLKARLEIKGNLMFDRLRHELNFPFKRVGIVVAAFSEEEMGVVDQLYRQGVENGVPGLEICGRERLMSLEPKLNPDVVGGLYAPTGGVVEPYRLVFALVENAVANGVELKTIFKVIRAEDHDGFFRIEAEDGRAVDATYAVNAAGLFADEVSVLFGAEAFRITPRKGEEFLLERDAAGFPNHVVFPVPARNSKGMLVIPTVEGTMMIGPTAIETDNKADVETTDDNLRHVFESASGLIRGISRTQIITSFAGLRPTLPSGDFYIECSKIKPRLVQVAGIQSPGLTAAPAIGEYVKDLLRDAGLRLTEKPGYHPETVPVRAVRHLGMEERRTLAEEDPRYGNIICQCETISEGEIVEAIAKGHTTVDGIKFYTRAGMGSCQGGFCTYRILQIISRQTGRPVTEITKRGAGSELVVGELGHV